MDLPTNRHHHTCITMLQIVKCWDKERNTHSPWIIARARMPPVLVPATQSKSSLVGRPASFSKAINIWINTRPLMPPPSRHRSLSILQSSGQRYTRHTWASYPQLPTLITHLPPSVSILQPSTWDEPLLMAATAAPICTMSSNPVNQFQER